MCRKKFKSPSLNYAMLREIVTEIRWMSNYIIKYRAAVIVRRTGTADCHRQSYIKKSTGDFA